MCMIEDQSHHTCVDDCPICFAFTITALQSLCSGDTIHISDLERVISVARRGCILCRYLVGNFEAQPPRPGAQWPANSSISLKVEYRNNGDSEPLSGIALYIHEPLSSHGTDLLMAWRSFDFGLYARDQRLSSLVTLTVGNPSVASSEAFTIVREWLTQCRNDHNCCTTPQRTMPTRVLNVSPADADCVKLELTNGRCDPYAALSYCWGTTKQVILTKDSSEQFVHKGIPTDELPRTIQDAVKVCRQLGIQYLWVDACCIDQSDAQDKLRELANMKFTYKEATVTISAAATTDCDDGFLQDRVEIQDRLRQAFAIPVVLDDEEPLAHIFLGLDKKLGLGIKSFDEEHINTRAWTYQEAWLSPRILIYGTGAPQWRCFHRSAEMGNEALDLAAKDYDFKEVARRNFYNSIVAQEAPLNREQERALIQLWENVLVDYARRLLTYPTDRLPALSGLAVLFWTLTQDDYLAGLWKSSLPTSLLWRRLDGGFQQEAPPPDKPRSVGRLDRLFSKLAKSENATRGQVLPFIAPSWSPLSLQASLAFEHSAEPPSAGSLFLVHHAEMSVESPIHPFGKVKSGRLEVTAPMMLLDWPRLTGYFVIVEDGSPDQYWDAIVPDDPGLFQILAKKHRPTFNAAVMIENKVTSSFYADPRLDPAAVTALHRAPRTLPPKATLILPQLNSCGPTDEEDENKFVKRAKKQYKGRNPFLGPGCAIDPRVNRFPSSLRLDNTGKEFWLAEIVHSHTPVGLLLNRIRDNLFERLGYYKMGRDNNPEVRIFNGHVITGPRSWNYDKMLEMRQIFIV